MGSHPDRVPILTLAIAVLGGSASAQDHRGWRVYGGDLAGSKYSALDQIDRGNVRELEVAWTFRTGGARLPRGSTIQCNPIVVDGVMFVTSPALEIIALDAKTGTERWRFDPRAGRGVNRGVTYWSDGDDARVFLPAGSFVHAIDAKTGHPVRSFGDGGKLDLRKGLDQDLFFLSVSATSPGVVFGDLLIMGCRVGEGPGATAPGHIRAFSVHTGERRWIFHTIPRPGEYGHDTWPADAWRTAGGANSWSGLTLDAERGIVFCGTGSPAYDHYGGDRHGANLFGNCILALDAVTGERKWHYQVVHHDVWDYDLPCPPNLVTIERDGRAIDAIAQPTKHGLLFVLDRDTGEPLFEVEELAVPQSTLPGEKTWPTQPFPTKPPPYAQQRLADTAVAKNMSTGDVFLPPSLEPVAVLPQFNGGTNWGGAAFDPTTRVLYVNASNEAEWIQMRPSRPQQRTNLFELGRQSYRTRCSHCHGLGDSPANASLADVSSRWSRATLAELLVGGRGQMPSFATTPAVERRAIVAFLFGDGRDEQVELEALDLPWTTAIRYVANGHVPLRDPDGYPVNPRPWGTLNAIDLSRGEIRWQVPLGTYPALEKRGLPPTGTFNIGGPLVTAGGLVFIGAAMDERFHAFAADTGELLWKFQLDAGGYATPATYAIDGRQYVVIAAGGGGKPETKSGDAYYCFALPR